MHIRLLVRRAYERPFTYTSSLAGRYHLDPMKLKFPSKRPRSYARASDVSEIPKADTSRSLTSALPSPSALSRLHFSLSSSFPRNALFPSLRHPTPGPEGGSCETLAPCRNYRLAGINSRAYIE